MRVPLYKVSSPSAQVLGDWVKRHTLNEVMAAMKEARVPAGPILSTADIFKEEHFQQRDMFETATAPEGKALLAMSSALITGDTPFFLPG